MALRATVQGARIAGRGPREYPGFPLRVKQLLGFPKPLKKTGPKAGPAF